MSWKEIRGQDEAVTFLRQSVKKGRVVSAYLFQGPAGVGKELAARVLSQSLNCRRNPVEPCGECEACRGIEKGTYPDVFWLEPWGKSRSITIGLSREMQRSVYLSSQYGGWKVFIIRDAEKMNDEAANSLLKTLEEPPEKTTFLLLTVRPDKIPFTIRSRCQAIRFQPWPWKLMEPFLIAQAGLDSGTARLLHSLSGGQPGVALSLLREGFLPAREKVLNALDRAEFSSGKELIDETKNWLALIQEESSKLARELEEKRSAWAKDLDAPQRKNWEERDEALLAAVRQSRMERLFELLFTWFRDIYIFRATGSEETIINRDRRERIAAQARRWEAKELLRMLSWVEECRAAALATSHSTSHQFTLENLLLQLGFWHPPS